MNDVDLHARDSALLALAEELAREAGELVASGRANGSGTIHTKSTPTDLVTEYDRASEALIVGRLAAVRPDDGIVGEEGAESAGSSGIRWLIDPIDGTTNFYYGLPGYAVSIAAADEHGAFAGVVYAPVLGELFAARRGAGATLNGRPISCGSLADLSTALVATGFAYHPERRATQAQRVARLIASVRDVRRLGAASIDLCYVACGRLDAYFEEGLGPWDLAAGELIAREAGCRSGDFRGGPARPGEVAVAAPELFDSFVSLIRTASDRAHD